MSAQPAPSFICPACQTPLPPAPAGDQTLRCPACQVEVDAARLETLVGKPRFVAERSWTGAELDGLLIEERIGAGGMGTVYRARSAGGAGAHLAVKFLSPELAAEPELVARFWREVDLLEKLDHPAIVKVKAHGQNQEVPWFAMELVDGPTLAVRLSKGPLSLEEARAIFSRLLDALAHAHAHGVVHRDLKPANVLLASDGARLADFGIARLDLAAATRKTQLTRTAAILGTLPYMSPEQRAGRSVDARSDLYSIGVMVYEALAGERPEGAFPPLRRLRPEIPSRLDQVVLRLLQPDPKARYGSAEESKGALVAALKTSPPYRWPLAFAAGATTLALVAIFGLRGRDRLVPLKAAPPMEKPARKALPTTPEASAKIPRPDLPVQAEPPRQVLEPKSEKSALATKKIAATSVAKSKAKVVRGKNRAAAKAKNDGPAPPFPSTNDANRASKVSPKSSGKSDVNFGGKKGNGNEDDLFGPTMK